MEKLQGRWLIATSTGPDSMALLDMCLKAGMDCVVAHVNYHHRKQAEQEEAYIRSFCDEHALKLFVHNEPFTYEGNFEAAARDLRYSFFVDIAKKEGLQGVLIGHHEDDLLETFIMQDSKNIIPAYYGLKEEIIMQGVLFKRPLLHMSKAQLLQYCDDNQITYFIDETNLSDEYTRNQIRHQQVEVMSRFVRDAYLQEIKQRNAVLQERRCRVKTYILDDRISLRTYRTLSEDDRLTMLRMFVEDVPRYSLKHLKNIDHTIMHAGDFIIEMDGFSLVCDGVSIIKCDNMHAYSYSFTSLNDVKDIKMKHFYTTGGEAGVNAVTLSEDDFPITIRSFMDGDKIRMRFGSKQIHRFFIDRHISLYRRKTWPVVVNVKGEVILVPGLGCNVQHYSTMPNLNVVQY